MTRGTLALTFAFVLCMAGFFLEGCQLGGKETTHEVIMIEPGDVVEIADDREIQIIATVIEEVSGREKKIVSQKRIAGLVAMPKSVYRELRARAYPEAVKP